jgi:hypothetical protein
MHHLTDDIRAMLLSPPPDTHNPKLLSPPCWAKFTLFSVLPAELRLKIWTFILPSARILKIKFSSVNSTYLPNSAPPALLATCPESRALAQETYTYLQLGHKPYAAIPFNPSIDNLYISELAPILQMHIPDLLYNLSTSPSRNLIRKMAVDLRVWNECCEKGLLGVLGRMRDLREVNIVVEFGRHFRGDIGFLDAPEWRSDLRWVAEMAEREVCAEMGRARGRVKGGEEKADGAKAVVVKCVLLTKGGEQA